MNTKQKMIEVYLSLGKSEGFDKLSLSKITDAVGIRKASFYSHFKSFTELEDTAEEYCMKTLASDDFQLNTKAESMQTLLEYLFGELSDFFASFPINALYSLIVQKKNYDKKYRRLYSQLEMMVNARILVALDFCVQHSWTDIADTDALSVLLAKAFLSNPDEDLTETAICLL